MNLNPYRQKVVSPDALEAARKAAIEVFEQCMNTVSQDRREDIRVRIAQGATVTCSVTIHPPSVSIALLHPKSGTFDPIFTLEMENPLRDKMN